MSYEDNQQTLLADHQQDFDNESITEDRLRELQTEQYFIEKLKKQREKVEILRIEFQEQEKAIERQQTELMEWQRQNEELKRMIDLHINKEKQMEVELADRQARLLDYERKYERVTLENRKLKESCEQYKQSLRLSSEKLTEQETIFSKNFQSLRGETKSLERQTGLLKERFKEKTVESNELYRSLQLAEKTVSSLLKQILKMQQEMMRQADELQYTLEEYARKHQHQEKQIASLIRQTEQQKSKIVGHLKLISDYQEQEGKYQRQIADLEQLLENRDAAARKLEEDVRTCLEQIKSLEGDLDKRQSLLKELNQKKKTTRKYDSMRKELVSVRDRQAEQLDNLIQALNSRRRPPR